MVVSRCFIIEEGNVNGSNFIRYFQHKTDALNYLKKHYRSFTRVTLATESDIFDSKGIRLLHSREKIGHSGAWVQLYEIQGGK